MGLVTPTREKPAPESTLNSEDFPLPVPPASVTTVCAPDSRSRSPARPSRSAASSSSSGSNPSGPPRAAPIWTSRARAFSLPGRLGALDLPGSVSTPGSARSGWAAVSRDSVI